MKKPKPVLRILIVEDDPDRARRLRSWLPDNVRTVVVASAGRALGVLERDRGSVYAGILLDHDLQEQAATDSDRHLSGSDVVDAIIMNVSKHVPVLVQSVNVSHAPIMADRLESAGFWVTRIPMDKLTKEKLGVWMEEVCEIWEDLHEE